LKDLDLEAEKEKSQIEKLETALAIECEKTEKLDEEVSGSKTANSELQKQLDELQLTIKEKDAEIKRIKAQKPKFTKKEAQILIKGSNEEFLNYIDKKMGKV